MEILNHAKARKRGVLQQGTSQPPPPNIEPLRLERVYGSGAVSTAATVCPHPIAPGLIAFTSGAVVVLYDSQHKQQTAFFTPKSRRLSAIGKPYSCLAFSRDGAYLAAGERNTQSADILIWEVSSGRCLHSLHAHKHGVGSVAFSHDGRLLVSTGESYDGQLCVWDWQRGMVLAKQHTQAQVQRACFAEELAVGAGGLTITTVGKGGHFKVWSLSLPSGRTRDGHLGAGQAVLTPRPATLKEYRTSDFVSVAAAPPDGSGPQGLLYALTRTGVLLTLRPATRIIDKSVNLQVNAGFALAVSSSLVACACAAGTVRLFATKTLAFKGNLPRPTTARGAGGHAGVPSSGGSASLSPPADPSAASASAGAMFPDAVGCAFDCTGERLVVVYADRTLMVWDVRNPSKVTRSRSVLSHSGIVWGAALIPSWQAPLLGPPALSPTPRLSDGESYGPSSVVATCGTDGTVRLWNVCLDNSASTAGPLGVPADAAGAARVTRTLRATLYADPPLSAEPAGAAPAANRRFNPEAPLPLPGGGAAGGPQAPKPVVLRCLRVSPCGRHLATGDSRGNLRVYNLATMEQILLLQSHDAEVLSLDYSPPSVDGSCFLASASRDMLVHVYDMSRGYELAGTCDAHSGAVTAVRFSAYGGKLALLSCSADKSVVFRLVQSGSCGLLFEIYNTERVGKGVLYDLAVDPTGGRAVAVGQDNQLRLFDVATGRPISTVAGDPACGEAVAVIMDPTGQLAVCSCSDGSVAIYDLEAGALLARGSGHCDVCTNAVLLEDYRGLVTVGGDGCALLWRLTPRLAQRMQEAAAECRRQLEQQAAAQAATAKAMQQQQQVTPEKPRRRGWDVGGGVGGGGGGPDAMEVEEEPDAQQVHVDLSATIQRARSGQPIVSVEKLPRWAQQALTREANQVAGDVEMSDAHHDDGATPGGKDNTQPLPLPAGKWAQRVVAPPPIPPTPASAAAAPTAAPPAQPVVQPVQSVQAPQAVPVTAVAPCIPPAFGVSAASSSMAARAAALADQPRTWAEVVEEDDEIVFCDLQDEGQGLGPAEVDVGLGAEAADCVFKVSLFSPREPAAVAAATGAGAAKRDGASAGMERRGDVQGTQQEQPQGEETVAIEEPPSACASNCLGGPVVEEDTEDGAVKRDLFREHFDSLQPDEQFSATKLPPPDPRRMSFTHMYRHARASSGAGTSADPAAAALAAVAAAPVSKADGAAAAAPGGAATPVLAKMPLPATITTARGGTTAMLTDGDGAVTGAVWTPERSMLPLMSPILAKGERQVQELERIRQRLLSTLRKRQTNDEAALGSDRQTPPPAPEQSQRPGAMPLPLSPVAAANSDWLPIAPQQPTLNAAPSAEQDPGQAAEAVPRLGQPGTVAQAAPAPAMQDQQGPVMHIRTPATAAATEGQSREQISYGGGVFLPGPPSYTPAAGNHRRTGSITAGESLTSPGFSTLSTATPMCGQGGGGVAGGGDATPGYATRGMDVDDGARLYCVNPMYSNNTAGTPADQPMPSPRPREVFVPTAAPSSSPRDGCPPMAAEAAGQRERRAATADEVIRAVLEPRGDGGEDAREGGVCVVTHEGPPGGKDRQPPPQQQQEQEQQGGTSGNGAAREQVQAAGAKTEQATAETRTAGRRGRAELPAIRPKGAASPAKTQDGPSVAPSAVVASLKPPGQTGTAATVMPEIDLQSFADLLSRMKLVARDFAAANQRLQTLAAAGDAAPDIQAMARAYRETAQALGSSHQASATATPAADHPSAMVAQGPGDCGGSAAAPATECCPLAVACPSPRVSLATQAARPQGSRKVLGGRPAESEAVSASVLTAGLASSQVVVDVVESMVEEKLQERMKEELRRVEESVLQRIMQMQGLVLQAPQAQARPC